MAFTHPPTKNQKKHMLVCIESQSQLDRHRHATTATPPGTTATATAATATPPRRHATWHDTATTPGTTAAGAAFARFEGSPYEIRRIRPRR